MVMIFCERLIKTKYHNDSKFKIVIYLRKVRSRECFNLFLGVHFLVMNVFQSESYSRDQVREGMPLNNTRESLLKDEVSRLATSELDL